MKKTLKPGHVITTLSAALLLTLASAPAMAGFCSNGNKGYYPPPPPRAYYHPSAPGYYGRPAPARPPVRMHPMAPYAYPHAQPAVPAQQPAEQEGTASAAQVAIANMQFNPPRLTIKKGDTVTWTQVDNMPHTVTSTSGAFGSSQLTANATNSFSQQFTEAGQYDYVCSLHPGMRGTIIVTE